MRSKLPPFHPFEPEPDFDAALSRYAETLAALGFDAVRLLLLHEAAEPERGAYDEAYLARYDRMVEAFAGRGMRVVVDSHQDVFSRRLCGDGFPDWMLPERLRARPAETDCPRWELRYFTPAALQAFERFWSDERGAQERVVALFRTLAERYRDEPAVIGFEPMNEPFPGWRGLLGYRRWQSGPLNRLVERVARAVRAVDRRFLVFADICPLENQALFRSRRRRPDAEGLVLAPHYYDAGYARVAGRDPGGGAERMRQGLLRHAALARRWDVPTFVGEFGVSMHREDAPAYLARLYGVMDALGLSGAVWEASAAGPVWNRRDKNLLAPDGTPRNAAWAALRPRARAVPGVLGGSAFQPGAGRFRARWEEPPDAEAEAEIVLPRALFGDDPTVVVDPPGPARLDPSRGLLRVAPAARGGPRRLEVTAAVGAG